MIVNSSDKRQQVAMPTSTKEIWNKLNGLTLGIREIKSRMESKGLAQTAAASRYYHEEEKENQEDRENQQLYDLSSIREAETEHPVTPKMKPLKEQQPQSPETEEITENLKQMEINVAVVESVEVEPAPSTDSLKTPIAKSRLPIPGSSQQRIAEGTRSAKSSPPHARGITPRSAPPKSVPSRFAPLTRENLLALGDSPMARKNGPPSHGAYTVSGASTRLYDPNYLKRRQEELERRKAQLQLKECTFTPRTNSSSKALRSSPGSAKLQRSDSIDSTGSAFSVRTDISPISSRLYQPDYLQRRAERLERIKQERDLMDCTFKPVTNVKKPTRKY